MAPTSCIVIGGTHSSVGKTSVATALMAAYTRRGLRVQGFKVGPDFIDPSFHSAATGRASHNLDGWMLSREANLRLYTDAAQDADLCIVEGVMGLFDGRSANAEDGSTAQMAKWLGAPVLLVVDGAAMARSGAALVRGFESFDPDLRLAGVLFNRVSGDKHFAYLRDSVRAYCRTTPLGSLRPEPGIKLPERHLGLHFADEVLSGDLLAHLADWVETGTDLDALLALASGAGAQRKVVREEVPRRPVVRIAVARDRAFQFYYEANLQLLRDAGAELIPFSPMHDAALPEQVGGVYLGGGYPELHAVALRANTPMRRSIRAFAESGGCLYAECGGFMYLTEAIQDQTGAEHPMCGLFPTRARMQPKLAALGYASLEVTQQAAWLKTGMSMRAHEFRYSSSDPMPEGVPRVYTVRRAYGDTEQNGYALRNVVASYFHVHFGSCPEFAESFVAAAAASVPNALAAVEQV